jgi:hypothetical protein
MIVLKKLIISVLLFGVLAGISHVPIVIHYCCGEPESYSLYNSFADSCCDDHSESQLSISSIDCCSNLTLFLKSDSVSVLTHKFNELREITTYCTLLYSSFISTYPNINSKYLSDLNHLPKTPPPLLRTQSLLCVLLI